MSKEDNKFSRGGKRQKAIEIMKDAGPGHKFEDITAKIRSELGIPEGAARSYYRYCVKEKLLGTDFIASNPTERKPREKKTKSEETIKKTDETTSSTPNPAATKDRLATIKAIASKRKPKKIVNPDIPVGSPAEEQMKKVLESA